MENIRENLRDMGPCGACFHFAWGGVNREEIDNSSSQKGNIENSIFCLQAARDLGCRVFIDAGSRAEYGPVSYTHLDVYKRQGG